MAAASIERATALATRRRRRQSMIPKSGYLISEKIMLRQQAGAG